MKPIEQLTEILCEVPEIKEDLFEPGYKKHFKDWGDEKEYTDPTYKKVEERHLRMYCEKKEIDIEVIGNGIITIFNGPIPSITKLDNTKSLHNQSDEVIQNIIDFLKI